MLILVLFRFTMIMELFLSHLHSYWPCYLHSSRCHVHVAESDDMLGTMAAHGSPGARLPGPPRWPSPCLCGRQLARPRPATRQLPGATRGVEARQRSRSMAPWWWNCGGFMAEKAIYHCEVWIKHHIFFGFKALVAYMLHDSETALLLLFSIIQKLKCSCTIQNLPV